MVPGRSVLLGLIISIKYLYESQLDYYLGIIRLLGTNQNDYFNFSSQQNNYSTTNLIIRGYANIGI